ncbi:LysR family transcriptional regulator [Methyloligella halotolerans]|nr:LysR family transcriptional regulator [Methyloligella halotolerans]
MTLEQLRIFVEAARFGSFTVAAQQLGLTQSAVSISIRKLEEEHGVSLFDRVGRRVVVSEAGQVLLGEGERILKDIGLTALRVQSYKEDARPRTVIACSHNAYDQWIPVILSRMGRQAELPDIDLLRGSATDVTAWVMRGTADVGLSEVVPGHTTFHYFDVFRDSLILCASPDHPQATNAAFDWADLPHCAPVIWERGTDLEPVILQACDEQDIDRSALGQERLRLVSTAAVACRLLGEPTLAGFVTESVARPYLAAGELTRLGRIEIPVPYWAFALRHRDIEGLASLISDAATTPAKPARVAVPA